MLIGFFVYFLALFCGLGVLRLYTRWYTMPLLILFVSYFAHAIAICIYSGGLSDSVTQYFPEATSNFEGIGTHFIFNLLWLTKSFFTGSSLIGAFYFYGIFAFLGGVLWYCLYIHFANRIDLRGKTLFFPAMLLMCWPSIIFFSSGMGKDSLSYFLIPLFFLSYLNIKNRKLFLLNSFLFIFSLVMLTMIRPYLLMLLIFSYGLYLFPGWGGVQIRFIIIAALCFVVSFLVAYWVLSTMGGLHQINFLTVAQKIQSRQVSQARGTFFPMPSLGPIGSLIFVPYSFLMNLFFPLGYLAESLQGWLASFENIILLVLCYSLFKNKELCNQIFIEVSEIKFILYFFLMGVFFLALVNTNLGLSIREKIMYLPCLLILYSLVFLKKNVRN